MPREMPTRVLHCGGPEVTLAAILAGVTKPDPRKTVWVAVWPVDTPGAPEYRHLIQVEADAWCLRPATALCTLELQAPNTWFIGELATEVSVAECPVCRERLDTMTGGTP